MVKTTDEQIKVADTVATQTFGDKPAYRVSALDKERKQTTNERAAGQGASSALRDGDEVTISAASKIVQVPNTRKNATSDNYGAIAVKIRRNGGDITDGISFKTLDATVYPVDLVTPVDVDGAKWLPLSASVPRFKAMYGKSEIESREDADYLVLDSDTTMQLKAVKCYVTEFGSYDAIKRASKLQIDALTKEPVIITVACAL